MAQVFVVADAVQVRKLICLVLQQEGHTVVEASNGKKAIRHIQEIK